MKILQVMAGGDHGGAETAFVDMCIAMQEAGVDIEVVTRGNAVRVPALEQARIKVHKLPFGGPLDVFTPWKLGRIIKDFSPLIVQTWMARATQKTPNWSSLKTPQRYLVVSRLGGYYKLKNFKSADYFNTVTPCIKSYLVKEGVAENRIRQINNFAENTEDAPVSRADFNTPEDAPVVLALGRLHPSKAHDVLLRALVDLPGVHAWIAGEGPQRAELEALAKELGVESRAHFLGWRTDRTALLKACDVCVFVSRFEPFGTVFVQSWAAQRPLVVSDADGPKQFCHDGEDCLMVPKDNAAAVVSAVQKLLGDKALQQKLVQRAYERFQNEFTKEKSVSAYLDYFLEILQKEKII
ncbi:MAG: glycosyl transferase [Micavibrio aeruginosavorus]|uniref:Glycosyl transferase n=1 Tax=Micavibrio aeruginosavorus TaxID=349221 RepID=A0A2W5PML5_9BACT|nr:MAG: glycosyl transferase [Micavibrio aeruginosavorus]